MRITPAVAGTALLLLALPSVAAAHPDAGAAHGFFHGFQHPFSGWDHLLAMVAVGLWAVQRGGRAVWTLPAVFVAAMALGGAAAMAGMALPGIEFGIMASVLVFGALIAVAVRLPLAMSAIIVAGFAVFHGAAHGAEMPAGTGAFGYAAGFSMATALLHLGGAVVATAILGNLRNRPQLWVRAAGASISVAGILLLVAR